MEVSLYFNRARYYNPDTGRFTSRDPIGQNDQINLYTYVANSPLNYIDLTGEFIETVWDIGNVAYDVGRGIKNIAEIGYGGAKYAYGYFTDDTCLTKQAIRGIKDDAIELGESTIDIGGDVASAMIPFVPAGTTKVLRIGKKIEKKGEESLNKVRKSLNQVQKDIEKGKAPNSIDRLDKGNPVHGEQNHIHFNNDSALNYDGSWKHGGKDLTNKEIKWLKGIGWTLPK